MSWITSPQNLTFLTLPLLNMNSNYLMVGQNADSNLFAYQVSGKGWIISNTVGYNYKMNGNRILKPIFQDVNGYCYWTDNYYYLYYELKFGWILINGKFPGYTPMEYQYRNDKGETFWGGDNFYTGSLPSESGSTSFSRELSDKVLQNILESQKLRRQNNAKDKHQGQTDWRGWKCFFHSWESERSSYQERQKRSC